MQEKGENMKLVTFGIQTPVGEIRRVGAIRKDGKIVDLTAAREVLLRDRQTIDPILTAQRECPDRMLDFIRGGQEALAAAQEAIDYVTGKEISQADQTRIVYDRDSVQLLTPIPRPNSVRCFSLSEKHMLDGIESMKDTSAWGNTKPSLTKMPEEWYNLPTYYKTGTTEIYGSDEVIPWPELTNVFDFELEIAVIIGKEGRSIPEEEGEDYIYGYTIYNDWSTRDFQNREMSVNLGPGLCKDNASSLGPCIVTKDEIPDIEKVMFTVSINDRKCAETHADFYFPLKHLVYYVSRVQTIFPGDIFTSGTLPGGSGGEKKNWIAPGDVVTFEGEGIGRLRNIIGKKGEAAPLPAAQRNWIEVKKIREC